MHNANDKVIYMKATFSKIQKIFLSLFLYVELVVFLALSWTIIYCHCFKISPTITEALSAFGIHLVYSTVAVALPFKLFYFYCYSKKQTEELRQNVKNQLRISKFKTEKMIRKVKCI